MLELRPESPKQETYEYLVQSTEQTRESFNSLFQSTPDNPEQPLHFRDIQHSEDRCIMQLDKLIAFLKSTTEKNYIV